MNKKKILIVDDEAPIAELLSEFCEMFGYETRTLNGGSEVLQIAKEYNPDLITLDLSMPDLSGTKVLAILKKDAETKEIPVMVISSMVGDHGPEASSKDLQMSEDQMSKPVKMDQLKERINTILTRFSSKVLH